MSGKSFSSSAAWYYLPVGRLHTRVAVSVCTVSLGSMALDDSLARMAIEQGNGVVLQKNWDPSSFCISLHIYEVAYVSAWAMHVVVRCLNGLGNNY